MKNMNLQEVTGKDIDSALKKWTEALQALEKLGSIEFVLGDTVLPVAYGGIYTNIGKGKVGIRLVTTDTSGSMSSRFKSV